MLRGTAQLHVTFGLVGEYGSEERKAARQTLQFDVKEHLTASAELCCCHNHYRRFISRMAAAHCVYLSVC